MTTNKPSIFITLENYIVALNRIIYFEISKKTNTFMITCHLSNHKTICFGNFPSKLDAHLYLNKVYLSNHHIFMSLGNDLVILVDAISNFHISSDETKVFVKIYFNNDKFITWGNFPTKEAAILYVNKSILMTL